MLSAAGLTAHRRHAEEITLSYNGFSHVSAS